LGASRTTAGRGGALERGRPGLLAFVVLPRTLTWPHQQELPPDFCVIFSLPTPQPPASLDLAHRLSRWNLQGHPVPHLVWVQETIRTWELGLPFPTSLWPNSLRITLGFDLDLSSPTSHLSWPLQPEQGRQWLLLRSRLLRQPESAGRTAGRAERKGKSRSATGRVQRRC
jgi:hypothetical protein